ncbi:unnamed protein product [Phytophthora fragariaefolia]|uniref:Unnamed protein product n=1 Tax=Phytophthora fragariaefolia TaxID=1490495 RepID=A0A9W6Y0U6_9STRA|nr:unnamed protein product [Phytophthora fragariaefolia]
MFWKLRGSPKFSGSWGAHDVFCDESVSRQPSIHVQKLRTPTHREVSTCSTWGSNPRPPEWSSVLTHCTTPALLTIDIRDVQDGLVDRRDDSTGRVSLRQPLRLRVASKNRAALTVILCLRTRRGPKTAKKRVRFAGTHGEDSEALPVEPEPPDRPNDVTTESSHVENGEISPGAAEQPPNAEDIDPFEVQEERRRRVGRDQDKELCWANLKFVLEGESSSLGYKATREAWKTIYAK